jgi:hypothetical protein
MNWSADEWGEVTHLDQTEGSSVAGSLIFGANQKTRTLSISPKWMTR